jgi:phytol kinase
VSRGDIIGLVLSYAYAFGLLFGAEALGRWLGWQQALTRKIIHIGAGCWIWGILLLFDHWYYGIIPFATFILLNYLFYLQQTFKAMDGSRATPGTVYFAASITVLFALLWRTDSPLDRVPIAAAATMAMTWGDAFASLIGDRWGRHRYVAFGHPRSWEGTVAMAALSLLSMGLVLRFLPGSALSPYSLPWQGADSYWLALVGSAVATLAEALSPAGTDNLSVPLLSGLALYVCDALF